MARNEAYFKAVAKIMATPLSATALDLSWMKLTELPECIGQLTQLHVLGLSHNQLTILPESLGNLTQLAELYLVGNPPVDLPKSIGNLTKLRWLDLQAKKLTSLPEWLRKFTHLRKLSLSNNGLTTLPDWIGQLTWLQELSLGHNELETLPESIGNLTRLQELRLNNNKLETLPESIGNLTRLQELSLNNNKLETLPESIGNLTQLQVLYLYDNRLTELPASLAKLEHLGRLELNNNLFTSELAAAAAQGIEAIQAYLRAQAASQVTLYEAKLILVGEGEVGKSCLLGALRGEPWEEGRPTTHGIEIKPFKIMDAATQTEITLNGWDFGGQRVYRPTHQLFFSAPAVYLVVWKPREGPQQGFVKEWIKLVKHREPEAKILVVATHGGPDQRQPDIDRQELRDLFGTETVLDFFHVESKPERNGERHGIEALKQAIARVAMSLPEVGRSRPQRWQEVREAMVQTKAAYLPLESVIELCRAHQMDDDEARIFLTISHRLGHLIYYEHDPALCDIVVLKPDWLATAISFVLDDGATRQAHGLVHFTRLGQLWNAPTRAEETRYPVGLHPIFLRLMERFDLSYRVAHLASKGNADPVSLIAQLVPDNRPESDLGREWPASLSVGDLQQVQICRIVDSAGQSATAEGLFFQLIVRLHKYSLGRADYSRSVHWQRGLVLDDDYNGRALLEHVGNDVRLTVRAPYPERFLAMLTGEVKYLVESFWEGLRCQVMVPCTEPCGNNVPGTGLFEVQRLINSKRKNRPEYPCPVCNEWQNIDALLRNASAIRPMFAGELFASPEMLEALRNLRHLLVAQQAEAMGRFDKLDAGQRELLSKADASYTNLMQVLTDEAKEGPRLFSFVPVRRAAFNPKQWTSEKFRLTLWCEHSRLPLSAINGPDSRKGVYEIELTRDWVKKAAPFLKVLTGTLSLALPVASAGVKLALDETMYKAIEDQLDFGKELIDASFSGSEKIGEWLGGGESMGEAVDLPRGEARRARGATLRELQILLKEKDPGFGGLVRVQNKRQEFLWVHPQFEKEY